MDKGKIIGSIGIVAMAVLFCYFVLLSANSLNRAYADVTNSGATTNTAALYLFVQQK